jgi:hypothetical protein
MFVGAKEVEKKLIMLLEEVPIPANANDNWKQ